MLSFSFGSSCKFFILTSSPSFLYLPTSVGHTLLPDPASMHHSVHPHIRGAYVILLNRSSPKPGSSPHTWGIQELGGADQDRLRFIPTYVGHTACSAATALAASVHPHIRGAYALSGIAQVTDTRFIPTYVGHTPSARYQHCRLAVHPHIRGAYYVRVP